MLKNSIDESAFASLPDVLKGEYKKTGDAYTLQHDDDAGAIKRARDREKERADTLKADRDALAAELSDAKKAAAKVGSPEQIAAAAKEAAELEFKPIRERAEKLEANIKSTLLSTTAKELATAVGGAKNAVALMPHVERRLEVSLDGDTPAVIVRDSAGKPSKLTTDELAKELRADSNLASLVVVSAATGGAGRTIPFKGQSSASGAGKKLSEMSPSELAAHMTDKIAATA